MRNDTFLPLLAGDAALLHTPDLDPERIADRLAALLDQPAEARAALGARLADRVRESYSLDGLIDRLVGVFAAEIARRKGAAA